MRVFLRSRIIESLRFQKTSKVSEFSCPPTTPTKVLTEPSPQVHIHTFFSNTSRDSASTTSMGSPFHCFTTLSMTEIFLISTLNLPWHNLRPFPLLLSFVTWQERLTPHLTITFFQVVVESSKVIPQPQQGDNASTRKVILRENECTFLWRKHLL